MSEVISFRLDPKNPREAEALRVLARCQEQGYSVRHILTEALLAFEPADAERQVQRQMEQILTAMNQIADQLERLQWTAIQPVDRRQPQQAILSDAFVVSVKSAARPGLAFDG